MVIHRNTFGGSEDNLENPVVVSQLRFKPGTSGRSVAG
jgi:hypothetical protein